jgi:hypothetical protein
MDVKAEPVEADAAGTAAAADTDDKPDSTAIVLDPVRI